MNTPAKQPNESEPVEELSPSLREAVRAVRGQPVPPHARERALRRAAALRPRRPSPWGRVRRELVAVGAIAAVLFLGLGWLSHPDGNTGTRVEIGTFEGAPGSLKNRTVVALNSEREEALRATHLLERIERLQSDIDQIDRTRLGGLDSQTEHGMHTIGQGGYMAGRSGATRTEEELLRGTTYERTSRDPRPDEPPIVYPSSSTPIRTLPAPNGTGGGTGLTIPRPPGTPATEFGLPSGDTGAKIDPSQLPKLAEVWGNLPDKERQLAALYLARDSDPKTRAAIETYLKSVASASVADKNKEIAPERPAEAKPVSPSSGATASKAPDVEKSSEENKPAPKPRVWRRNGGQPTMARVYVGDGNSLDLVSLRVSVLIDGPRARTVVDQVFRNPHDRQLEGTFEYPLPTGASPSYFGMFLGDARATMPPRFGGRAAAARLPAAALARKSPTELVADIDRADWGRLQEARVVAKDKALETYEDVVRGRIDPALLEYAGGNTFRGRVFPIAPKGFNRVLLAYEELLPLAEGQLLYRFPLPDQPVNEVQFTLTANAKECKYTAFLPRDAKKESGGGQVTYTKTWTNEAPKEGLVLFAGTPADPQVQAVGGRQGEHGPHYLYARLRPDLKKVEKAAAFAEHAVFLLDTSLSEHPARFDVNMKLMKKILESDNAIKRFNVLTFNVGSAWVEPKGWLTNDAAGREKAFSRLDGLVLEGATDVGAALDRLGQMDFGLAKNAPLNVFLLSDGHVTWGESDVNTLVARFERDCPYDCRVHCYRVGLGAENAELFDALARRGGGVFNCLTEPEVAAAAVAHRNECFKVEGIRFVGGPEASDVLIAGRRAAVYPGGELVVAARLDGPAKGKIVLEGRFLGHAATRAFTLETAGTGELAARGWAEVAVASLLALNDSRLDGLVTAYCQQFGIVSRVASFLVLENDNDYKRFNLEAERGKTVNGDLGQYLEKLWRELGAALSARQTFQQFLDKIEPRAQLLSGAQGENVKKLLALLTDAEFELPASSVRGALVRKADVPPAYLAGRDKDRRDVHVHLKEAQRRAAAGDVDGAVRVLSSVIEEHPGRGDALRLVGYRLLDLKQPAQAARLFHQVQRQRPFEPHSYRDLARSLEESGLYGLAAVQYEIVLAGTWHNRFRESLKLVAQEEYARMMQDAIRRKAVGPALANYFGERLERMASPQPRSDLRVTISWNTDATDVDLWVIEPDGTKVFYSQPRSKNGGELSQDQTQGYGPERYQIATAQPGEYKVIVHYYAANPNLLGGETHVNVTVTRHAGTPQETTARHTVILKKPNEEVEVCRIKY